MSRKTHLDHKKDDEETLGLEVPYFSAIGALKYLANYTQPDITQC